MLKIVGNNSSVTKWNPGVLFLNYFNFRGEILAKVFAFMASYFSFCVKKKSNQKKNTPSKQPFGFPSEIPG